MLLVVLETIIANEYVLSEAVELRNDFLAIMPYSYTLLGLFIQKFLIGIDTKVFYRVGMHQNVARITYA